MRPSDFRHNSMARSTAQSEGLELSTGTKISRYTSTSPFGRGEYVSDETGCQVSREQTMQQLDATDAQWGTGSSGRMLRPSTPYSPLCVCASSRGLSWHQLPTL